MKLLSYFWNCQTTPFKALLQAGIILPVIALSLRFSSAMWWRLVGDTLHYKTGFIVQVLCMAIIGLYLLFCLRLIWNAVRPYHLGVRAIWFVSTFFILIFWMLAPSFITPIRTLLNDMVGKVYYIDGVTAKGFVVLKEQLETSIFPPKKIMVASGGGDVLAGLAIAKLVNAYQLDVYVGNVCASSCANYIFLAGRYKWLNQNSIIMYHGNTQQEKFKNLKKLLQTSNGNISRLPNDIGFGIKNKELTFSPVTKIPSIEDILVRRYLGIPEMLTNLEYIKFYEQLEVGFYKKIGVDLHIAVYGQVGKYESTYKSYQYEGFYYSLEDMARMGVKNIRVKNHLWQPETNDYYSNVYKVNLPNQKEINIRK